MPTDHLGSAPTATAARRGLEDRRVRLGGVMPGESPSVFGDALRRLATSATYLYQDGPRYWYATQPTVTKVAEDRAEQLRRDLDKVAQEIDRRVRLDLRRTGEFRRIHPMPGATQDVSDDLDARLVVLDVKHPYSKEPDCPAVQAAQPGTEPAVVTPPPPPPPPTGPKRYHGTVALDPTRVGRDASRIAEEVIGHLAGLVGARVTVTLEIEADIAEGAPENGVRIVTENGRTLKFEGQGFEKE